MNGLSIRALLVPLSEKVRNSYWFVPSLMAIGAIILALVTTAIDSRIGADWIDDIDWLNTNQPAGACAVLSTVAGSMITVAGVTFSMTILSISSTTSQVGPRLLNNFMADKANQFTLGVFIATFLYCLMVLRTVRNAESLPPGVTKGVDLASAFVPHLSVMVGVLLAIASVGVLIFYIHHIPETIHVSNIVAHVGRQLDRAIEDQFPAHIGEPKEAESNDRRVSFLPPMFDESSTRICSNQTGYLQYIDGDALIDLAQDNDLVLHVQPVPGDFINRSTVLVLASPQDRITDDLKHKMASMFVSGAQRSATQDLRFLVNQLVEVAMRALSPGVNDPFTAMSCMEWLQSGLESLAKRELPASARYDDEGKLRLVAAPVTFATFASLVFDQLRPYVAADRNASVTMMEMLGNLLVQASDSNDRRVLARHACALRRACERSQDDTRTLALISRRYRQILGLLAGAERRQRAKQTGHWIH